MKIRNKISKDRLINIFFTYVIVFCCICTYTLIYLSNNSEKFHKNNCLREDSFINSTTLNNYETSYNLQTEYTFNNQINNGALAFSNDDIYYTTTLDLTNERQKHLSKMYKEIARESKNTHLHDSFKYREIDRNSLKKYLSTRNSILMEEPYFSTIINISEEFNLNPLLLFAITGQEQSFVPRNHHNAEQIANNPFNVFNSWQKYNTDIEDSTKIASRTVVNLSKDRPPNVDPFIWINRKYSEDKNWSHGVKNIYYHLEQLVPYVN